jgi:hypothetical protein
MYVCMYVCMHVNWNVVMERDELTLDEVDAQVMYACMYVLMYVCIYA